MRCPSCGEDNPERAKFCLNCATPLLPANATAVRQERKVVSVLFCDLVGFTAASERADPEDVHALLSAYHAMLRTEIERYGGTVEKFIGDAVMAIFGAPAVHEDDVERAVRAGLRLVEATAELNERRPGSDLQVRVGVNTGEVLVNLSARPERGEGYVTGDVVNTASRLQGVAPVGGVVVGRQTYESTKEMFDYVELPVVELKGKAGPVQVFHAVEARSRFGSDLTRRHTTPLVGREIDLALLKGAFDKAVSGPSLQLVTVLGEPGVGKSRLVTELFRHIDSLPYFVRFRQGRCPPYGDGITFWAIGEIVKAEAGVLDSDDPATATEKLTQSVAQLVEDPTEQSWFVDRLAPLLGLTTPSAAREETFTAWRRYLEAAAAENPLVCVIEDLHWADEALLAFIAHLAEWSEGLPVLVVCTARPELYERHPSWGAGLRNRVDISLDPLSPTESAKLVSALLGRTVVPAATQTLLVEQAGGNPLYAEEFVRMLTDRGLLDETGRLSVEAEDLTFPSSVQAIIAARLDTLSVPRKAVLQDAAVIGKVFWAGAVAALAGRAEDEVALDLHELFKKELVRRARTTSMSGQLECSFWHAYIRDVAYGGIPRATRASKHVAAARWIEEMVGARVEEYAEILAHHYLTAARLAEVTGALDVDETQSQARRHLLTAARRALYVEVPRALNLARSALEITPSAHRERSEVERILGDALRLSGRPDEARELLDSAIARAAMAGDDLQRARCELSLARVAEFHDRVEAGRIYRDVIGRLESLPPGPELVEALRLAAGRAMEADENEEVAPLTDRVLELLDAQVDVDMPRDLMRASVLNSRGIARVESGDAGGIDDLRASVALQPHASGFHDNLAFMLAVTDGLAPALRESEEAIRLAALQGAQSWLLAYRVSRLTFHFAVGRWEELLEEARSLLPELIEMGDDYERALADITVAQTLVLRGVDAAPSAVADLLPRARSIGDSQVVLPALVVAASAAASASDDTGLVRLLAEIEPLLANAGAEDYIWSLPEVVRLGVAAGDVTLAERAAGRPPSYAAGLASAASARGAILESRARLDEAIASYAEAVQRWETHGHVVEHGHALLGLGRSRLAAGDASGAADVLAARGVFSRLGAQPLVAEADLLLAGQERLSS